jgi:WD40 repeat protein
VKHSRMLFAACLLILAIFPHLGASAQNTPSPVHITAVAWSPDLSHVATGDSDGKVRIWNAINGEQLLLFTGHTDAVFSVAWSPDQTKIASGSYDKTIRIWDSTNGNLIKTFTGHTDGVTAVIWSQDNTQVISGSLEENPNLRIWNPITGQQIQGKKTGSIGSFAWSPDGKIFAVINPLGYIHFLASTTFEDIASPLELDLDTDHVIYAFAWSPDGSRIAAGDQTGKVRVWDKATGQVLFDLVGNDEQVVDYYTSTIHSLIFSANGTQLSSISADGTIRTWDAKTGRVLQTVLVEGAASAAAWSPDGTQLAYAVGDTLHIIPAPQVQPPTPTPQPNPLHDYPRPPYKLAYSPDGSMIAGSADRLLRVWDAATGATLIDFPTMNTTYVLDVTWSPDNKRIATASDDQYARVWNIDSNGIPGKILAEFQPFPDNIDLVTSIDWRSDGQVLAIGGISDDYSLKLWDANTYAQTGELGLGWIEKLVWHPDSQSNKMIIAGSMGGPVIVSTTVPLSGAISAVGGRNIPSKAMAWNSDGSQIAIGYDDGKVIVWDSKTDTQISEMAGTDQNSISQLSWSPDNTRIAAANGTVRVWNSQNGQLLETLPGISASVDFSPDGTKLVYAAGAGAIQIVDAP